MPPKIPKITGYSLEKLPKPWKDSVTKYTTNGAVTKVGEIECVKIKTKGDLDPVHKSSYNPDDNEDVISLEIEPKDSTKKTMTHHCYADGTGTMRVGDKRQYSTMAEGKE
ncbi:hypothetical protein HDK77DRAFT_40236 [Phyllosticta capitalensis]